jgi:hypothetical protein
MRCGLKDRPDRLIEVIVMTATRQPERLGRGHALAAMHRAARAMRELHDEVVTGTEAVVLAAGIPWQTREPREPARAGARPARRS